MKKIDKKWFELAIDIILPCILLISSKYMDIIAAYIIRILIGTLFCLLVIKLVEGKKWNNIKLESKKIKNNKELNDLIKKLIKKYKIRDKDVIGKIVSTGLSKVKVIKKYKEYLIEINNSFKDKRIATVYHEFYHIISGQSDLVSKLPYIPIAGLVINIIFDLEANKFAKGFQS